jgi:hypothetical protein
MRTSVIQIYDTKYTMLSNSCAHSRIVSELQELHFLGAKEEVESIMCFLYKIRITLDLILVSLDGCYL